MKRQSGNGKKKSRRIAGVFLAILTIIVASAGGTYFLRAQVRSGCEKAMALAAEKNREDVSNELNHRIVYLDMLAKLLGGNEEEKTLPDLKKMRDMAKALEVGIYFDQDGQFYLSDGSSGQFADDTMRKSVENNAYSILAMNIPEMGNMTCLTIVLPIIEGKVVKGIVFGYFDIVEFIDIFSKPVYENSGFSFLADKQGNVIVPATAFSSIDEAGNLEIDGVQNREGLKILVGNICKNGAGKIEVDADGVRSFVYGVPLENYTELAVITLVDIVTIYKNVFRVSAGVIIVSGLLIVALLVQFITALRGEKNKKKEIAEAVNTDALTGLSTKPFHKKECENILKKSKSNYAYIVMDVSDFSAINAACGYDFGSDVLKHIGKTLQDEVEKNECCSRTSADHFALMVKYENQDKLMERLYSICDRAGVVPEEIRTGAGRYRKENIVFNCGVYLIQSHNEDINRIRARANTARKSLKKAIHTQIGFYNDDDFRKKMENHDLEMDLLKAVANNEMVVFLQPKYSAVSEEMNGAEALVRWNHPTKGMIGPNLFIPVAEGDGYVKVIDFFVFNTVCEQLSKWLKEGYKGLTVSVNFSRRHLTDEDFIESLSRIADEHGVEHKWLEIELTETADFNDMDQLLNVMYKIKEAGFGLAMDDFGSGYSSLQLLMKMPAGVLKMDKSLIEDCAKDNDVDNKMAANIISLAQGRGHSVVAEGVETEEQKDILRDANCDTIQGYYYSKPITIQAFEALMAK